MPTSPDEADRSDSRGALAPAAALVALALGLAALLALSGASLSALVLAGLLVAAAAWAGARLAQLARDGQRLRREQSGLLAEAKTVETLRSAAHEWRETFDAIDTLLVVTDPGGQVLRLNRAASSLAGRAPNECVGKPLAALGEGYPWREARRLVGEASTSALSSRVQDAATGQWWDVTVRAFKGDREPRAIVVMHDVTQMVALEASLRESEKMSAMGSLVAGVAHEVRNPIFGLSATLDAFEAEFGDREDFREYLAVLRGQLQRVSALMKDLMDYGRPHTVELEPGSVERVVAAATQACRELADRAGVRLRTELGPDHLPPALVDPERLAQVFQNLIENGIQHSPRGSDVAISLAYRKGSIQCEVRDSGPGLRAEDLPRVFEPFFTRRPGGTGLGLAICQRIVKEHSGTLALENHPAGGARAVLRIPIAS